MTLDAEKRPQWQTDVLTTAFDVLGIADVDLNKLAKQDPKTMTAETVSAAAFAILFDDLAAATTAAIKAREDYSVDRAKCGWCISAAGGTIEAWDAEPLRDDIKGHTAVCENNPLVQQIKMLEGERARFITANAELGEALLTEKELSAKRRARIEELEQQLAQRDATIRNLYETSNA
jgi:hypothetical protein